MADVVEASVFWAGELFEVKYFALGERVVFDDVPDAPSVEVRTRLVDAAPKMPRNRLDVPYAALAIVAALSHAMVVAAVVRHEGPRFGGSTLSARDEERIASLYDSSSAAGGEPREPQRGAGVASSTSEESVPGGNVDETRPAREELGQFGMISLLAGYQGGDAVPWVSEPYASNGTMWGDAIGDGWGVGGVALSGTGEGGGGNALGNYVLDHVHTGTGEGYGAAHGHLIGSHHSATITCRLTSCPITCTRLAPEVIKRIVRASEGRFRACYLDGLKRDPKLAGHVVTKFVIGRDGLVRAASDAGSDLPDASVVACVARAFTSLEFPAVPDGIATVTYPFDLQPE